MAVKATFEADFSSFLTAVDQAEVKLVDFQSGAGRVEASLSRMVDNFSGRKVIQDATLMAEAVDRVGGVSQLTEAELTRVGTKAQEAADKLRAMGQDVPPKIQSIANSLHDVGKGGEDATSWIEELGHSFVAHVAEGILLRDVIREIISLGPDAFANAVKFEDLARATGISIAAIQQLSFVGKDFGVDTDTMARGVEQLSAKLANGDKNAVQAVNMLGLSVKQLLAEGPAEAFLDVAEATGRVQDPMLRSGLAAEEFGGRLGKILLPALRDLRAEMERVPKDAILSDRNVVSAKELDVAWTHLKESWGNVFVDLVVRTAEAFGAQSVKVDELAAAAKRVQPIISPVSSHEAQDGISNAQLIENALTALRTQALEPLTLAQQANIDQFAKWGVSADQIAKLVTNGNVVAVDRYLKAEQALQKTLAETDAILLGSFEKRTTALKTVAEATLKAYDFGGQIASLNQLIASEEALARSVYNQLNSEKDRAKVLDELALHRIQIQDQINQLEQKHAGLVNAQIMAELDARRQLEAAVGRNADGTIGELNGYEKMLVALDRLHDKKQEGISQYNQENLIIKQYTDALYAQAAADDAAIQKTNESTAALRAKAQAITDAAAAAYKAAQDLGGKNVGVPTSESLTNAGIIASTLSTSGYSIPLATRDMGGSVSAGQPYLIGKGAQPELFVPSSSGTMYPAGSGGMQVTINVTQPLGTPQAIADAVSAALMSKLRGQGMRGMSGA